MAYTDEETVVRESLRKVEIAERRELLLRRFTREASVAALVLCVVGLIGLVVCLVGQFDLRVGGSADYDITHVHGATYAIRQSSHDLTSLFLGVGAAGFASSLIICGGVLGQLQRMPPGARFTVAMSAVVSLAGLFVLTFAG